MTEWILCIVIGMLSILLILSQIGWMIYSQRMVDRAMSRSYPEYIHAKSQEFGVQAPVSVKLPEDEGPSDLEILNQHIQNYGPPL